MKMHAGHIEVAVSNLLDYRKNIIVPNISHGFFGNHEADLIVVDEKNRVTEVEIKISLSDLKADFKKPSRINPSKLVSRLIYAIPDYLLEKAEPLIPKNCGIIIVRQWGESDIPRVIASWHRMVKHDKKISALNENSVRNLIRLGCMRIWTLKRHNNNKNFVVV